MGRKVQSWRWVVPASDMDDVHGVLISTHVACSVCISGSVTNTKRCKTSSVGQSAGLLILRSSVRFRQKLKKTENSNLYGFEVHRPSNKGTKLLLQVTKAIINKKIYCVWNFRYLLFLTCRLRAPMPRTRSERTITGGSSPLHAKISTTSSSRRKKLASPACRGLGARRSSRAASRLQIRHPF